MQTNTIQETSIVVAAKHPRCSEVDEEMVIVDLEIQEFYGLNPVGKKIWKLIQEPLPVAEINQEISKTFGIEPTECEADILDFLNDLAAANLIQVLNQ